eukprot:scaffold145015_cov151-Phaeocystis_antarctica.AAC.1
MHEPLLATSQLAAARVRALVPMMKMCCGLVGSFCHATCSLRSLPTFFLGALDVSITSVMPLRSETRSAWTAK